MTDSSVKSSTMLTTREVAPLVMLNKDWQDKYRRRAQELLESSSSLNPQFTVCIVGRCGVGKGALINHLLLQNDARIAHNVSNVPDEERIFEICGFRVREIPGYDGKHAVDAKRKRHWYKSSHGSQDGRLELEDFIKAYRLFEEETNAIIFVINNRITEDDQKLMSLAIEARKFFCVVRTHGDSLVRIKDANLQQERLESLEEEIRKELSLITNLDVRIFIISIPWPERNTMGHALEEEDRQELLKNCHCLQFSLLHFYLTEPKGLRDELQIHALVNEEVWKVLMPFQTVRKRYQALEFSEQLVAGTLLPIAGPVMLTFIKTLYYTIRACADVGLIQDPDEAIKKVDDEASKTLLATGVSSKEATITAVHDSLVHAFGKVVYEIAIREVVSTTAHVAVSESIPLLGPMITAAHLPSSYKKISEKLAEKACMLHQLWVMQNITGLLSITE